MRKRLHMPSPAMGVALIALFIALSGTTYAATGGKFILGKPNSATSQTSLTSNNAGKALRITQQNTGADATALGLNVPAGKTPFTVNSGTKVANLNADRLDGLDSADFQLSSQPASNVVCAGCVGSGDIASGAVTEGKIPASDWHYIGDPGEPAFQNGWVNYDTTVSHVDATYQHAAYRRDVNGIIHLTGLVKSGTIGQPMFTLSFTNCPWFYQALPVVSNNAFARLTVQFVTPTCGIWVENGSNAWVSLDGISFRSWPLDDHLLSSAALQTLKTTGSYAGRRIH